MQHLLKAPYLVRPLFVTILALLVPLVAMQFSREVDWSVGDFAIAGLLLFCSAFAYEVVSRKGSGAVYRAATLMAVSTILLHVWANLAVGLIGGGSNAVNVFYAIVPGTWLIGVLASGFRAPGMARAMFAAAAAHILVPAVSYVLWKPQALLLEPLGGIIAITALFALLFIGSGLLFRQSQK